MCREFVACLLFMLCDEDCLVCMYVMLKEIFISFYEFVPAAQNTLAFDILHRVVGILCFSW